MTLVSILIINFLGALSISYIERQKSSYEKSKTRIIGEWPYNIVLLVGVLIVFTTNTLTPFIITLLLTLIFYAFKYFKTKE